MTYLNKLLFFLLVCVIIVVPLYPKFPLIGLEGSFVSIRLEDILIFLTFLIWLVHEFLTGFSSLKVPLNRAILIYLVIGFVSLFVSLVLTKSIDLKIGLLHAFRRVEYLLLFPVAYSALESIFQLKFLTQVLIIVSLIVGIIGLGQQFFGFPVITTNNAEFSKGMVLELGPGARINSTFAGHYDLAAFSILPLIFILGFLIYLPNKWHTLAIAFPIYWSMLLSASRVTFAAFYLVAFSLIFLFRKYKLVIPLLLLAVYSIFVSPQLVGRYKELIINHLPFFSLVTSAIAAGEDIPDALKPSEVREDRSLNIRLQASWPRAIRAFLKNPLLGSGFSSVGLAVDNGYLRLLAETGVFGFVSFLAIIIIFIKSSWSYYRPPKNFTDLFIICVNAYLVGMLLICIFIDIFEASKIAIITWTVLGLAEKSKQLT